MAENSKIEWTTHSFNPWIGCQKVSPGCDHCYAEARDKRFTGGALWGPHAPRRRTSTANWRKPLAWDRAAAKAGVRARVFCASLADVFDNHPSIDQHWRDDLWTLIYMTPHLDWLLLTKRPQNIAKMLPPAVENGGIWPNVWLGTTVENQTEAIRRIPHLLAVPAKVHFLSCEPLLGPVELTCIYTSPTLARLNALTGVQVSEVVDQEGRVGLGVEQGPRIDWVICGGESGSGARPMHPDWARSLRDQCQAARVAFFFKQWGEWAPNETQGSDYFQRIGKRAAGRLLDGRTWDEVPA